MPTKTNGLRKILGGLGLLLALWLCFGLWFAIASDYGDGVLAGTYRLAQNSESSTLVLKPDHTFQQQFKRAGKEEHAEGSWHHIGEGGIVFSKDFILLVGQEPGADGTAYAQAHKALGVLPASLTFTDYDIEWYGKIAPSADAALPGTYIGDEEGVPATLTLMVGKTFQQSVSHGGVAKFSQGTWSMNPRGDITFSKEFIKTTGESLREDETASALDPKGSNLQIEIAVHSKSGKPTFRKKLLPW